MKFISIFTLDPTNPPPPPDERMYQQMGALIGELMKSGKMLDTGGVMPSGESARVRRANGKVSVTDGPFTESKEVVCGFAVFDVESKNEAVELTGRFLALVGTGTCELHEVAPIGA